MNTPRNASRGMPVFSAPPSIPRANATKLQDLLYFQPPVLWPPVALRGNAAGCSTTRGKGWPLATRPCRQKGTTVLLTVAAVAATARRALTRSRCFQRPGLV